MREREVLLVGDVLVTEEDDEVIQQRVSDLLHGVVGEIVAE